MGSHPHPADDLSNGRYVSYQIKFEGIYSVGEASGPSPVQCAFLDMKKAKDERRRKGQKKAPIMEIQISTSGVKVINPDTNNAEVDVSLSKISFIMNDRSNKLYAAFIVKTDKGGYECVIVKDDSGKAKEIVMTLAEAFDLAFQKRLEEKTNKEAINSTTPTKVDQNNSGSTLEKLQISTGEGEAVSNSTESESIINQLRIENEILRRRMERISELVDPDLLTGFLFENRIETVTEIRGLTENNNDDRMSDPLAFLYAELLKSRSQSKSSVTSRPNERSNTNPFMSDSLDSPPPLPQSITEKAEANPFAPPPPPRVTIQPPPAGKRTRANSRPQSTIGPLMDNGMITNRPGRSMTYQTENISESFYANFTSAGNKVNSEEATIDLLSDFNYDHKPRRSNSNQAYQQYGLDIFDPINSSNKF